MSRIIKAFNYNHNGLSPEEQQQKAFVVNMLNNKIAELDIAKRSERGKASIGRLEAEKQHWSEQLDKYIVKEQKNIVKV